MGEFEVIDLVANRVKNGEKSLYDLVASASYSDGAGSGGKQLHGLGLFVVAAPTTGTVGGIDRSGNSFWQNKTASATMSGAQVNIATANPSTFLAALNSLAISCTRGSDRPDLYIGDGVAYKNYLESLQPIQRITNEELGGYGFTNLKYYGVGSNADFVLDNGYCPAKTLYALNTEYIYLRPHPDRNFVPFGGDRIPVNQDATVRFLGFTGNMCASNLALQGIMTSIN